MTYLFNTELLLNMQFYDKVTSNIFLKCFPVMNNMTSHLGSTRPEAFDQKNTNKTTSTHI